MAELSYHSITVVRSTSNRIHPTTTTTFQAADSQPSNFFTISFLSVTSQSTTLPLHLSTSPSLHLSTISATDSLQLKSHTPLLMAAPPPPPPLPGMGRGKGGPPPPPPPPGGLPSRPQGSGAGRVSRTSHFKTERHRQAAFTRARDLIPTGS